jgi:hypothetical protein
MCPCCWQRCGRVHPKISRHRARSMTGVWVGVLRRCYFGSSEIRPRAVARRLQNCLPLRTRTASWQGDVAATPEDRSQSAGHAALSVQLPSLCPVSLPELSDECRYHLVLAGRHQKFSEFNWRHSDTGATLNVVMDKAEVPAVRIKPFGRKKVKQSFYTPWRRLGGEEV